MAVRMGLAVLIALSAASSVWADIWDLPRLGQVRVVDPVGAPLGLVIVFSDPAAPNGLPDESLHALAEAGRAVAAVDTGRYLAVLDREGDGCLRVADDLAKLKSSLQQHFHLPPTKSAVLAGAGAGGAVAYAALAQSDPGQFDGAVAFEFNPELESQKPLCSGAPSVKTPSGYRYLPDDHLRGFWRMATASPADERLRPYVLQRPDAYFPLRPYDDLASAVISVLAEGHSAPDGGGKIEDLPLVLLPAEPRGKAMAVIYSGDGGWRDLDKQIGDALQRAGIPVVGVDCLRYFWHRQTPETAAQGLERIVGHFTQIWQTPEVLLIGYSFGADVIPFLLNRLAPETREQIRMVALLGLSRAAEFEIRMSGWLGGGASADAMPLAPELGRLDSRLVQCFYGAEEQDQSGCTDASLRGAEIIQTAGGHHFDGDYDRLVREIVAGAEHRGLRLTNRE